MKVITQVNRKQFYIDLNWMGMCNASLEVPDNEFRDDTTSITNR